MSFFTKKNFLYKLIVCICIFFSLMNFCSYNRVYAKTEDSGVGGVLVNPIANLICALGDAIMDILQKSVMGTDATIAMDNSKPDWWSRLKLIAIAVLVIVVGVVIAHFAPGLIAILIPKLTGAIINAAVNVTTLVLVLGSGLISAVAGVAASALSDTVVLPLFTIGPEEIFSGRILLFDANIFNPKQVWVKYENEDGSVTGNATLEVWNTEMDKSQWHAKSYYYYEDGNSEPIYTSSNNSASQLKNEIAKWYYIIRNMALVGTMITLLYIGIRMTITSIAADKAKYKQMLYDWVIALCLMVFMHYIMIFAHNITDSIIQIFSSNLGKQVYTVVIDEPGENFKKSIKELEKESGETYLINNNKAINWPTNLMGQFRLKAQEFSNTKMEHFGFALAYLALVILTLIFSITYIKRLLYLLFLTIIAPLVALTYPLDKINDGKAQAFNMWLREYIFNLLIQPFHLLLYTVFVTMAFEIASTNVIYSLVVIGFMVPAEKFLRTMFGFNKASTPGMFNGAAGAALTMSAVHALGRFSKGGKGSGNALQGKKQDNNDDSKVRMRSSDPEYSQAQLFEGAAGEGRETSNDNENTTPHRNDNLDNDNLNNDSPEQSDFNSPEQSDFNSPENEFEAENDITADEEPIEAEIEEPIVDNPLDQMPDEQSSQQSGKSSRIKNRITRLGIRAKANGSVARHILKESFKEEVKELPGKAIGRAIGGAIGVGTATLAAGGSITASVVKGDAGDLLKNTGAAVATGIAVGSGVSNRISGTMSDMKRIDEQAKRKALENSEYKKLMQEKEIEKFEKNRELRKLYKEKLNLTTREQVNTAMKQAAEYKKYGVEDDKFIIKAMKVESGNESNRDSKTRIAAAKIAEAAKTPKDLEAYMKSFSKTPGITKDQTENVERLVRQINIDL